MKLLRILKFNKRLAIISALLIVIGVAAYVFIMKPASIFGVDFTWTQSAWTTETPGSTATHPGDQTGFSTYDSKTVDLSAGISLTMNAPGAGASTETDTPAFSAGDTSDSIYVNNALYPQKPNTYACESNDDNLCQSGRCDATCQAQLANGQACDEDSDCTGVCTGLVCETPWICGDNITIAEDTNNPTYGTVEIGTQCWLARNLNVGTITTSLNGQTNDGVIRKWCYYGTTTAGCDNSNYGGLYQWNEAMGYVTTAGAQGICPTGWHIPTDTEIMTLEEYQGMCSGTGAGCSGATGWRGTDQGSRLAGNDTLWTNGDLDSNANFSASGFTALPAGYGNDDGYGYLYFYSRGSHASLWSSTQYASNLAWSRFLSSYNATVYRSYYVKTYGFSVRCLKD